MPFKFDMEQYLVLCLQVGDELRTEEQAQLKEFLRTSGCKKIIKRLLVEKQGKQERLINAKASDVEGQHAITANQNFIKGVARFIELLEEAITEENEDDEQTKQQQPA